MKAWKFGAAQIAYVLRQAEEATAIGDVCRAAGINEAIPKIGGRSMAGCCRLR